MKKQLLIIVSLFVLAFAAGCSDNSSSNADNRTEDDSFRQAQLEGQELLRQLDACETLPLEEQGACIERVDREYTERQLGIDR